MGRWVVELIGREAREQSIHYLDIADRKVEVGDWKVLCYRFPHSLTSAEQTKGGNINEEQIYRSFGKELRL